MKTLALLLTFASFSTWAHDLNLKNYFKMQDALAKDDFKSALSAHSHICEKELAHYKDDYKGCPKKFKDIAALRETFKDVSKLFMENSDKKELENAQVVECSMAKAKWIQPKGEIRNPYYGASMLTCGQKI